ncbi:MAG: hypothetical protein N2201_03255 [candidate division WOR-3 bacterium]|nr:hypothetical protein [candidate division WOR-3 bacterium]
MYKKVVTVIFMVIVFWQIGISQTPFKITLSQSAPEAGLFFSNPSYISPALADGTYGMFSNPAAIGYTGDYGLAFVLGIPSKPKIECNARILDSTDAHGELSIPLELAFKDAGGLNFFGFSKKLGPVGVGIGYMQKSGTGFGIDFNQTETLDINYRIVQPIRASIAPGIDTTIPMTWNISAPIRVNALGNGDISLGKTPFFVGSGYSFGIGSVGIGFKIARYSGNLGTNIKFDGSTNITATGTPGAPYKGNLTGIATLSDTFINVIGNGDFRANRLAFIFGGLLRAGFFKMGISLEQGFKTNLSGNYNLTSLRISGAPDSVVITSPIDSIRFYPAQCSIAGNARFNVLRSPKTGDTLGGPQTISLPGYTELNLGISLSVFDLYLGGTLPKKGEVNNGKVGILFSVPLTSITIRTGLLAVLDYAYTTDNAGKDLFIPLRVPIYAGLGASYRTKFNFIPMQPDAQVDFGIKSNAIPLMSNFIPSDFEQVTNIKTPSFFSLLSFNLGVGLKI